MNFVTAFFEWFNDSGTGLITIIFSGVVAWTAVESNRLNRRLVDAELDPFVTVNLEARLNQVQVADIVIRNGGRGAATNLRFSVDFDKPPQENTPNSDLLEWRLIGEGLPLLGPGQEVRSAYGTYADIDIQQSKVIIVVDYGRIDGRDSRPKSFKSTYVLDVHQLAGTLQIGAMIEEKKLRAINRIADDIHAVTRGNSNNVKVLSTRRYSLSFTIDRFVHKWFGLRSSRRLGYWKHFTVEIRQRWDDRRRLLGIAFRRRR